MKKYLFRWLYFTRSERFGTAILLMVCVAGFAAPSLLRALLQQEQPDFTRFQAEINIFKQSKGQIIPDKDVVLFVFDPNTATFEQFIQLGISKKTARNICSYREKGGHFSQPEDFRKIYSLTADEYKRLAPFIQIEAESEKQELRAARPQATLFNFDPNVTSEADLLKLGLAPGAAKSILGYRAKGGQFRKKEDLKKIYALTTAAYERIAPFISFEETPATRADAALIQPVTYGGSSGINGTKNFTGTVDINRAPLEIWQQLPGIGEKRARLMLSFRERLGGFIAVEQVGETIGLPDSVFQRIKPLLMLATLNVRKININSAAKEDLAAHPYCSEKQASLLVQYRIQNGVYTSIHDLDKIAAFADPKRLAKIKPYLDVQ